MQSLTHHELTLLFLAVALLLLAARVCGELAQRAGQPSVLGELLAGIILGPTVLGAILPEWPPILFPTEGPVAYVLEGVATLAIVLFLLVAGMEVDLSVIWREGRTAVTVGLAGIILPFFIGLSAGVLKPVAFGMTPGAERMTFAIFLATALSISALPVIAKTLLDLNLYRSDLGMIVIASAVLNDLFGWIVFAIVLGMIGAAGDSAFSVAGTVALVLAFTAIGLTVGRSAVHRALPWVQAHTSWPGGVIGFALTTALLGAAFTEWIGVHGIFGAFLVGVAVGDSPHLRERTRNIISEFISLIFAPLFFATIGVKLDFAEHFDPLLCAAVLALACTGKVIGCAAGARWAGLAAREAWAVGFGMNARGAMEIILGVMALRYGLINERMFVALVVMAIGTSIVSGPMMRWLLRLEKPVRLSDLLDARGSVLSLKAIDRFAAIRELAAAVCASQGLDRESVEKVVLTREAMMATGIGNAVAVPHGRIAALARPVVAVGLSQEGIDFDARDNQPARMIFLILTPVHDDGAQLKILAEIARRFSAAPAVGEAMSVRSFTEFLALLKTQPAELASKH